MNVIVYLEADHYKAKPLTSTDLLLNVRESPKSYCCIPNSLSKIFELDIGNSKLKYQNRGFFNSLAYSESLWNLIKSSHRGHIHPIIASASRPETAQKLKYWTILFLRLNQQILQSLLLQTEIC